MAKKKVVVAYTEEQVKELQLAAQYGKEALLAVLNEGSWRKAPCQDIRLNELSKKYCTFADIKFFGDLASAWSKAYHAENMKQADISLAKLGY